MSGVSLYVYFRATSGDDQAVAAALGALRRAVVEQGAPAPQLWRRPDLRDGQRTWMEVHRLPAGADPKAYRDQLDGLVERCALAALIVGERHVEVFEALDPPCA